MKKLVPTLLFITLMVAGTTLAGPKNSFDRMAKAYETTRFALIDESLEDVHRGAEKIVSELEYLRRNITAAEAGVVRGDGMIVFAGLDTWIKTARTLQSADSIAEAREAFQVLSEMLIGWRNRQTDSTKTIVVWCPITREKWLQAKNTRKDIRSPYADSHPDDCDQVLVR